MKKKKSDGTELSFDFDTPMPSEPKPTVSPESVGFQSEIRNADQYRWGRSSASRRVNMLTAEEVMGKNSALSAPVEPVRPAAPERPSAPAQSIPMTSHTAEASAQEKLSPAARMVLRLMQDKEKGGADAASAAPTFAERMEAADREEVAQAAQSMRSQAVAKAVERRVVPEFSDTDDDVPQPAPKRAAKAEPIRREEAEKPLSFDFETEDSSKSAAEVRSPEPAVRKAVAVAEPAPAAETPAPQSPDSGEDEAEAARRAFVDSFVLDDEELNHRVEDSPEADAPETDDFRRTVAFSGFFDSARDEQEKSPAAMHFDDGDFDFLSEDGSSAASSEVETIEDYRTVEDADAILTDFLHRKVRLTWRSAASVILTVLLWVLTFVKNAVPFGQPAFFVTVAVLLGLGALVNISLFTSVVSLFRGRNDTDFAPAFALLTALAQTVLAGVLGAEGLSATSMLAAAAMTTVAFHALGKLYTVRRVLLNFDAVANEETKNAVSLIDSPASASFADPGRVGESLVFGRRKAIDLGGFIEYSLSADPYEKMSFRFMIVSLAATALSACVCLFVNHGTAVQAVTAAATVAAVSAPFSSLISSGRNLFRTCRRLRDEGAMLSGYQAAEDISEANVVAFSADDLFCDECVSLYNFKTFHDYPIDAAIITAAALTKAGNSPLAGMFNEIVATNSGKVPAVDTVIYEERMGLTGWVNDRKTLLGNRMILESHNIPAPPLSLDKKIASSGKYPVYLAVDDKLVAVFIVGYTAKRSLLHRIRRLINTGVTLLVDTMDPNITEPMIAECYGIPHDAVVVMSSDSARRYREAFSPAERERARMTSSSGEGYIDGYLASYNLRQSASFSAVITAVMVSIGLVLAVGMPLLGMGDFINVTSVLALHAINYIFLFIVNLFYRF